MMRWIIGTSLKFRILVVAIAGGMMLFGLGQFKDMPIDAFPEFAPPKVEIQTPCIGLSASEVEALVTVPIEEVLNGLPGLDAVRSKSVSQLSSIVLIFNPGTDLLKARQEVAERISNVTATLPTWASPPFMLQPLSSTSRVMKVGLTSNTRSQIEMSMIAYWTIRARLLRVPGVANVAIWGERLQMLQVQADPKRLAAKKVSLDDLMEATAGAVDSGLLRYSDGSVIGTGGFIDTPNQRLGVRHVLAIATPADLAQVAITERDGKPVLIGDVANVLEDHQPLIGDAVINGGKGLMLIVEKLPWGNTLEVTEGVEKALAGMQPGLPGIEIDTSIFRPATFISKAVDNLASALLLGCLLVIFVLIAFLFEWRSALISLISIPLSLTAAGLALYFSGSTINTMVLAGLVIAVGVVVDDAIIDVENILRRLRQRRAEGTTESTASIILEASIEVRGPIVVATLIIVAAAAPVFFLQGLTGSFFKPLAMAYTLAVLASLLVALTVTPALALMLLRGATLERGTPPLVRLLRRLYTAILRPILRTPVTAYVAAGLVVLAGIAVLPQLGQSLFPAFKERDFLMHWVTEPGTSQPEMIRITEKASAELHTIAGVLASGAHIGQALLADEVVGINFAEIWVSVDPNVDYDPTVAQIQHVVDGYPGLRRDVQTYLKERTKEVLTGAGESIVVRIFGPDLEVLRTKATEVQKVLGETQGVIDEHISLQVPIPQIDVTVKLAEAQKHGLKPGDVRRAAATLVAGEEVGDIFRDGKAYDVQVWSLPLVRGSLTDIQSLPIDTPDGGQVRLSEVAEVALKPTPNLIEHDGGSRRIDVGANARGRDLGSVVREIEQKLKGVQFPHEYHYELLGEYAERQAAQKRILWFALGAVIAIFLLLQISFGSWRLASLAFFTLPSALVGGVIAAWISGGIISLGSLVGFLTVLGIAARNSILLLSHYQHLEKFEGEKFGPDLVLRGSLHRLSPILMTTLATALALLPLVILGNRPGHEIEHPMAVVILGGLVTSTLLNLLVVPVLYLRFGKPREKPQVVAQPATA